MARSEATCPHCFTEMDIPRNLRGVEIECPQCERAFTPKDDEPPPLPPPPVVEPEPANPEELKPEEPKKQLPPGVEACPACGLEMDVPEDLQGREVECPGCRKPFFAAERERKRERDRDDDDLPPRRRRFRRDDYDDDYDDDDYYERMTPERRTTVALSRLKPAAIALLVVAILRLLLSGVIAVVGGFDVFNNAANRGSLFSFAFFGVAFFKESATAYGAWLMLNARSYGWGLTASILMLIPLCDYCCWFIYLGFGIWAIVVINDYDVRWLIRQRQKSEREMERHDP